MEILYRGKSYEATSSCSLLRLGGLCSATSFYLLPCTLPVREASIVGTVVELPARTEAAGWAS